MSENKIQIMALFGKSGAGKDYLCNQIVHIMHNYTQKIVSYTTRPKRNYELDKVDYHFITNAQFELMEQEGIFLETTKFLSWHYGTAITSLDKNKINVGVFNIRGISTLLKDPRVEVYPMLITAPDSIRLERSLNREKEPNCKEICRRFLADEEDFTSIPFKYDTYVSAETLTRVMDKTN